MGGAWYDTRGMASRGGADTRPLTERLAMARAAIDGAERVVIGAGVGLSTAAGLDFGGRRFEENFADFGARYGFRDMYSGDFYPFPTQEEYWAFQARVIRLNRYETPGLPLYRKLYDIVRGREYFVLTTNVESQFVLSGFPPERVFATQGDYSLFQCATACHRKLYNNHDAVYEMTEHTEDCRIPSALVPKCPVCGGPIKVNLRADEYFIEDDDWEAACARYLDFIEDIGRRRVVYLEFGVGFNTPGIIRYPFERLTLQNPNARLIRFNRSAVACAPENRDRWIGFTEDIAQTLDALYPTE